MKDLTKDLTFYANNGFLYYQTPGGCKLPVQKRFNSDPHLDYEDAPEKSTSRVGDKWRMDEHFITCGDRRGRPYVDNIVARWQNETGRDATLDGDGRTFAEISMETDQ